jgi:DNA-directed RNA polymerase specialized sigma24 family protein
VIDGLPYREVAEALRCTEDTARARVSRGLRRLAGELEAPNLDVEPGR